MREAEIEALARQGLAGRVSVKFDQIGDQNPRNTQPARRMRLRRDRGDQVLDRASSHDRGRRATYVTGEFGVVFQLEICLNRLTLESRSLSELLYA